MKDQQLIDELHSAVGDRSNFSTILTQNKLIQEQVLINTTKYSLETINKNLSVAQYLLNTLTTDVNFKSESNQTALHMLCEQESPSDEFIKLLIDAKADVNAQAEKETPLSIASTNKNITPQTLELIIKASLEQDHTQEKAKLALTETVEEYVKSLVQAGEAYKKIFLEGFTEDTFFTTPAYLNHKAIEGNSENLKNKILLFVKNGLDVNETYVEGETLLHIATKSKDEVFLNELLKLPNLKINTPNTQKQTALHIACSSKAGSKKTIEVLLAQKNIDVNIRDKNNNTPLGIIIKSTTEPIKPVFDNYQETHPYENEPDISEEEMLIDEYESKQISNRNYTELIELFLKHGLDVNATYSNDKTLLHIAAKNLNINMVTQLLSYKTINVNVRDQNNNTPLNIIIKELKRPINLEFCGDMVNDPEALGTFLMHRKDAICKYFELFLEHGLKVDDRYDKGKTLLHIAAEDDNYELVKLLINNEIDNTIRDENGHFAYEYAEKNSEIYDLIYCRELKNPLSATPQYHYSPKSADIAKLDNKIESKEFLQEKAEENNTPDLKSNQESLLKESASKENASKLSKELEFNLKVMASDIEELKQSNISHIREFVEEYIDTYKQQSEISVPIGFGLILNSTIVLNETELALKIIDEIELGLVLEEFSPSDIVDIMTCVDGSGYSVASTTLYSGNQKLFDALSNLIQNLDQEKITKTECISKDLRHLETVICCPQFEEFDAKECIENFIKPLYLGPSIIGITSLVENT